VPPVDPPAALAALSATEPAALRGLLLGVCASPRWAAGVAATRPWPDRAALLAANAAAVATLGPADLAQALAGHTSIGSPGDGGRTAEREQAGLRGADQALLDELDRATAAYRARFGRLFLICATGRTAAEMLAAVRERYPNDPATEARIVRSELRRINDIRLNRLLDELF
jgi:2-oxo-4-hydroxy-4-carboxy-5-ureidoimidazoline decarboxylase